MRFYRDAECTQPLIDIAPTIDDPHALHSPAYYLGKTDPVYIGIRCNTDISSHCVHFFTDSRQAVRRLIKIRDGFYATEHSVKVGGPSEALTIGDDEMLYACLSPTPNPYLVSPTGPKNVIARTSVMVDRGEMACFLSTSGWNPLAPFHDLGYDMRLDCDDMGWWMNGCIVGPSEDQVRKGGNPSQCDLLLLAGHGHAATDVSGVQLRHSLPETDDAFAIAPHENAKGVPVPHYFRDGEGLVWQPRARNGGIDRSWNCDVEWGVVMACEVLRNAAEGAGAGSFVFGKDTWDDVLFGKRPAHGLLGFAGSPFMYQMRLILSDFMDLLVCEEWTFVEAWSSAVAANSYASWGIVSHKNNIADTLYLMTPDTRNKEMCYFYSDEGPQRLDYFDVPAGGTSRASDVSIAFTPTLDAPAQTVLVARRLQPKMSADYEGLALKRVDAMSNESSLAKGRKDERSLHQVAMHIDSRFVNEIEKRSLRRTDYLSGGAGEQLDREIGQMYMFGFQDGISPIANGRKGNMAIVIAMGDKRLVFSRVLEPLCYRHVNRKAMSMRHAVEKLMDGERLGALGVSGSVQVLRGSLEYELECGSPRTGSDIVELVPHWSFQIRSAKGSTFISVPALENE